MRTIYKTGEQSAADPFEYVMSDGSVDRVGDIIEPGGWQLAQFKKNPIALWAHDNKTPIGWWSNVRVESGRLIGKLNLAARGTSTWIDTLWSLVEQRILRAVSVGFQPIESEPIPNSSRYGVRFTKSALLECSLVSVPANANALSLAKSLSADERALLFAESGNRQHARSLPIAEPGRRNSQSGKGAIMSLAEKIREAQESIVVLRDQHAPLAKRIAGEGDELTDDEAAEFDRLSGEIETGEKGLDRLRAAERSLAGNSLIRIPDAQRPASPALITAGHTRQRGRPMDLLIRMGVVSMLAHIQRKPPEAILAARYKEHDDLGAVIKAVTNPAQTDVAGWAAELVDTAIADFMESLMPVSVYAALTPKGARFTFGRNGVIKIPRRNGPGLNAPGDLRGAFVGEGNPIPVRRGSLGSISLTPYKMGVISTFTREIAAHSTPQIEGIIRQGIIEDTAIALDTALLDASPAILGVRPAGLLNGVVGIPGTAGGGIAAITADIQAALGVFSGANAANGLVILVNPSKIITLQWMSTDLGTFPFRDQVTAGNIGGIPFIASTSVPEDVLIMVRATDLASATGDTPEFDISDTATLHEVDGDYPANQAMPDPPVLPAPLPIVGGTPAAPVAAGPVRSLWQTASIGIRMLLDVSWAMRRAGMVVSITGLTW
jgi:HK97 family phage prohead protease/HK97 family phage major capsid protein